MKLCLIGKIFISKFYNNIKIMNNVVVITVFKKKDIIKLWYVLFVIYLFT